MNRSSFVLLVVAAGGAWLIWRRRPAALPVRSTTAPAGAPDGVARLTPTPPTQNTTAPRSSRSDLSLFFGQPAPTARIAIL